MSSTWSQAHPGAKGFTAIELMVVVAILAVLTTLAAPSFHLIIERWRVRQTPIAGDIGEELRWMKAARHVAQVLDIRLENFIDNLLKDSVDIAISIPWPP